MVPLLRASGNIKAVAAAMVAALLSLTVTTTSKASTLEPPVAVVAGENAAPGEQPFMASLQPTSVWTWSWLSGVWGEETLAGDEHHCGATLIAPSWVLTAAHCVITSPAEFALNALALAHFDEFVVRIGATDITDPADGELRRSVAVHVHPDWRWVAGLAHEPSTSIMPGFGGPDHDIALIRLDEPSAMTPVALSGEDGALARILGWGATAPDGSAPSALLQQATSPIVDDSACAAYIPTQQSPVDPYPVPIWEQHVDTLCMGVDAPSGPPAPAACFGDSGGPVLQAQPGASPVQVGVISHSVVASTPGECGGLFLGWGGDLSAFVDPIMAGTGVTEVDTIACAGYPRDIGALVALASAGAPLDTAPLPPLTNDDGAVVFDGTTWTYTSAPDHLGEDWVTWERSNGDIASIIVTVESCELDFAFVLCAGKNLRLIPEAVGGLPLAPAATEAVVLAYPQNGWLQQSAAGWKYNTLEFGWTVDVIEMQWGPYHLTFTIDVFSCTPPNPDPVSIALCSNESLWIHPDTAYSADWIILADLLNYDIADIPTDFSMPPASTAGGTISTFGLNGNWIYTPPLGFGGVDTIEYSVWNDHTSGTGTITIDVSPCVPPTPELIRAKLCVGESLTFVGFDGPPLAIELGGALDYPAAMFPTDWELPPLSNESGAIEPVPGPAPQWEYAPPWNGWMGTDGFEYVVSNQWGSALGAVEIVITPCLGSPPVHDGPKLGADLDGAAESGDEPRPKTESQAPGASQAINPAQSGATDAPGDLPARGTDELSGSAAAGPTAKGTVNGAALARHGDAPDTRD